MDRRDRVFLRSGKHPRWRPLLALSLGLVLPARDLPAAGVRSGTSWCATTRSGGRDAAWAHREHRRYAAKSAPSSRVASFDVGDIAVVMDEGDLALPSKALDLQRSGLRFLPTAGGYAVTRLSLPLEGTTGTRLVLSDDDSERVSMGFAFPYYGKSYGDVFVNSDGNLTFGEKDDGSTERNLGRLMDGPPRAAPLLADLNPGLGGTVSALVLGDHVTVTWQGVPQYGRLDRNTLQVTLWMDGRLEFVYDQALSSSVDEAVVGVAPGWGQGGFTAVDFSTAVNVSGGTGALAESFRAENDIDAAAVARRFYSTHRDDYQQLVVYTSQTLVPSGAFAYSLRVKNVDTGIGIGNDDLSADFGSGGRLESFVMMDTTTKYQDDLERRFLGEDSALSVLAHEVGHRWLTNALFRDGSRASTELLGRDQVHWSFFVDTDGSMLEGNDIQPQLDGTFRTVGASLRYSAIDQYLMGMRDASEVPSFFFVRGPSGTSPSVGRTPETGVVFGGTRRDVTMSDVVAALGRREPPGAPWLKPLRQAFIYVAVGGAVDATALDKLERIRAAWPAFFSAAAEGRGTVDPRLG